MKLSSTLFILVFFFTASFMLVGQNLIEDSGGSPVLVENNKGELFLIDHQAGTLAVKKSLDGGKSYEEQYIDTPFGNVKDIVLFNQFYTTWKIFVTAEFNGVDNIFSYAFNDDGVPVLEYSGPISTHGMGPITDLTVSKGHLDNHIVAYLQDGALNLIFLDPENQSIVNEILGLQGEKVSDYYIEAYFDGSDRIAHQGYYVSRTGSVFSGADRKLTYFEMKDSNTIEEALVSDRIASTGNISFYNRHFQYTGFMSKEGNKVFYYSRNSGVWELVHEMELLFSSFDIQSLSWGGSVFFHIVKGDGMGFADFDGTPAFETPVQLSSLAVKGGIHLLESEYGEMRGVTFIEDTVPPAIRVTAIDIETMQLGEDIPIEYPGEPVDWVFLEDNAAYLASFIIDSNLVYYIGRPDWQDLSFQWSQIDTAEWTGEPTVADTEKGALFSGKSKYSVYEFENGLFLFNKSVPGLSRFYTGAVYVPLALRDEKRTGVLTNQPVPNTLIFVDREAQ